jgi:site-specific recombinase XerD
MYFLTLYALGLRRKEALDVRVDDIDFRSGSLTVREGKFQKGRVLPFGPRYGAALQRYIETHPLLRATPTGAFLFPGQSGRNPRLSYQSVGHTLTKLLHKLGITAPRETRAPGLHSFRHSFSVHRIERWHREGVDLLVKLPLLAAFLGHRDIAYTQVYLTMTPERLELVGASFERMFGAATEQPGSDSHEA